MVWRSQVLMVRGERQKDITVSDQAALEACVQALNKGHDHTRD